MIEHKYHRRVFDSRSTLSTQPISGSVTESSVYVYHTSAFFFAVSLSLSPNGRLALSLSSKLDSIVFVYLEVIAIQIQ